MRETEKKKKKMGDLDVGKRPGLGYVGDPGGFLEVIRV
jgi:hypothetical protein